MSDILLPGLANKVARERARMTVYVDRDIFDIIRLISVEHESNVSRVVEEIIKEFLKATHRRNGAIKSEG